MEKIADQGLSLPILLAYGLLILLYLIILRLLLNMLQQLGDKHLTQKSVIDRDIHGTMTDRVETSMHAFDVYGLAIVIAKGGIAAIAMAAIFVLLILKIGLLATVILVGIAVLLLWTYNRWMRNREKPGNIRGEIRKYIQKSGSMGMIVILSVLLAVLLFVMIWLQ